MRTRDVHSKWYLVPVSYLVLLLLYVQKNEQRRTTQHRKTKGNTRHRTMLRCTAELYIAGLTGTWDDTANECYWHARTTNKSAVKHAARQSSKARQSTALRSAKLELQGITGHCTALRCCEL